MFPADIVSHTLFGERVALSAPSFQGFARWTWRIWTPYAGTAAVECSEQRLVGRQGKPDVESFASEALLGRGIFKNQYMIY